MLKEIGYRYINGMNLFFPKIEHFFDKIDYGFSFVKMNHSFWEMKSGNLLWKRNYLKIFDENIINDVFSIIKNIEKTKIILAASSVGAPKFEGNNLKYEIILSKTIKDSLPKNYIPYYAVLWKSYVLNKTISKFFDKLKGKKIIVVGMIHLHELKNNLKQFSNMVHYVLDFSSSKENKRHKILNEMKNLIENDTVFIIQAGDIFSTWIIYHLSSFSNKNCSFIDMGRSLDYFCPNRKMSKKDEEIYPLNLNSFYHQPWFQK